MSFHGRIPNGPPHECGVATRKTPANNAHKAGHLKLRLMLSVEVLRHASRGPSAVSNRSSNAMGTFTRLKNGAPTVILCPCTHSERIGNNVPHSTVKQATSNRRLLKRKLASRETRDSSLCSLRRKELFFRYAMRQTTKIISRKEWNHPPIEDCAKAWTELIMPLRVRSVPKIVSMKVIKISHTFHVFNMPRFSCIITECKKAVPVSQGMSDALSTGSHPQ